MLRQIDDEDHEHDPRDVQIRRSYIVNPCCCMSIIAGAAIVGVLSVVIAAIDLGLTWSLEKSTKYEVTDQDGKEIVDHFYPEKPPYSGNSSLKVMERYGASGTLLVSSIILAITVKWASHCTTLIVCIVWLVLRIVCLLIRLVMIGSCAKSDHNYIKNRGFQILAAEIIEFYFIAIVIFYSCHTYEDLKDMRAVAPFSGNIDNIDDELHIDEINRMHGVEANTDQHLGQKIDYIHMDVSEFRLQVQESRMSRLMATTGVPKGAPKRSSFNEEEYQSFKGSAVVITQTPKKQ